MTTRALIEGNPRDGYSIFTPDIRTTLLGESETIEEAKKDFLTTYGELMQCLDEEGLCIPPELVDLEFVFEPYEKRPAPSEGAPRQKPAKPHAARTLKRTKAEYA